MRLAKYFLAIAGATALSAAMTPATAATVTQCGPNICYEYDDAQGGVSSFGNPFLSGDALVFLVADFRAQSSDGAGLVTTLDSFVIDRIYSTHMDKIQHVAISEFGDYQITNGDGVSGELELDLEDNITAETGNTSELFTASGDSGGLQTWEITSFYNPAMHFTNATDVQVTITDTLQADTDAAGEDAWIQKKIALAATTVVPVPAAVWLFISALGAAGLMRRS